MLRFALARRQGDLDARAYYKGFTLRRFFIANDEKRRRREAEIASGLIKAWPRKSQREAGRNPGMEFGWNSEVKPERGFGVCNGRGEKSRRGRFCFDRAIAKASESG